MLMRKRGEAGHAELADEPTGDPARHPADGTLVLEAAAEDLSQAGQPAPRNVGKVDPDQRIEGLRRAVQFREGVKAGAAPLLGEEVRRTSGPDPGR